MDIQELINGLSELEHPDFGHLYVEWGGIRDNRSVGFEHGYWYYSDTAHKIDTFICDSLEEALECILHPPTEDQWQDNIREHGGEIDS